MNPIRLEPEFVERVWGTTELAPWFPNPSVPTGEVWFTANANRTSEGVTLGELMDREGAALLGNKVAPAFGNRFPVLVKFLFTREKLSVQVHPDDTYAHQHEGTPGKTEMWHVLAAQPGATLAAGFTQTLSSIELRQALFEGNVEPRLQWWPAQPGETYFIPAGTVHAIGGGLVICEIQQNSDITYRLWDYGRNRPMHLEQGLAVAVPGPHPGPVSPSPFGGGELLASCPYFATERFALREPVEWCSDAERFHLLVVLRGESTLNTVQWSGRVAAGECWLIPALCGGYRLDGKPEVEILRVYVPG
jgi:mannose-6-phosphate isomerase